LRRLYRHPYVVLAVAAGLPRLAVLLYERGEILAAYTDKSDDFALVFLDSGTYGFIPGVPSAYTQPLYGFFLIPIYWIDRSWVTVGAAHIAVAVATAWVVFAIGRRVSTEGVALLGALLATLHPYLVWHDMHLNREILDGLLAATVVLLTIVAAEESRSLWWAAGLGVALGAAIMGNARLFVLPLILGIWLLVQLGLAHHGLAALLIVCSCAALVLAPWVARNRVSVGCLTVTTDSRALWKANNLNTYEVLARGGWIDDVPPFPGAPPSPQDAGQIWRETGRIVEVDECEQQRFFQQEVVSFWREHPAEKLRLAGQAARLLWQPNVLETEGRSGAGTWRDTARSVVEPAFMVALYAFALAGIFVLPRSFVLLTAILLAYQTLVAMLFAGATRYRVPWDFLIAIMAAAGVAAAARWLRVRRYPDASARA
jgi:4-amino-4-deoxy-L-arabinose transferase-like glycosyltransferase